MKVELDIDTETHSLFGSAMLVRQFILAQYSNRDHMCL